MKRNWPIVLIALLLFASWQLSAQVPQQSQSPVVSVPGAPPAPNPDAQNQTAVAVKEVSSPAAPAHYQEQALWALMASFVIQFLKKSKWFGWITQESPARLKAQFSWAIAMLTAAGVHFAVSGNIWQDGGASLTISGLSFNAFKDAAWQWASQQAWYQTVVKEPREVAVVNHTHISGPSLDDVTNELARKLREAKTLNNEGGGGQ